MAMAMASGRKDRARSHVRNAGNQCPSTIRSLSSRDSVLSGRLDGKAQYPGGGRLAIVVGHERSDLAAQALGRSEMDGIECPERGAARRCANPGEFGIQFYEGDARQHRLRVGGRIGARHGLGHLDHGDATRDEAATQDTLLESAGFCLGDDELRDGRRVQVEAAQR